MTIEELQRWAEKVAEAARQGVQVERMWQQKLEQDQEQAQPSFAQAS